MPDWLGTSISIGALLGVVVVEFANPLMACGTVIIASMRILGLFFAAALAANPRHGMELVMGPLPAIDHARPLEIQVIDETQLEKYTRRKITYLAEPGDRVPAWLLIPRGLKRKAPAMLCLHQTTKIGMDEPAGLGGKPNLQYARELAERGYVTIAPDYPNFGEYQFDPYSRGYASATMKGIVNHVRAVDLLSQMPEVDAKHIGVIGHSLGGHNSLFVAAFDPRIKAVVTSCGFNSFHKYMKGNLTGWSHKGYMPRIAEVYGKDPARMPFDFSDVLRAVRPRAVFINAPENDSNFEVSGVRDAVVGAGQWKGLTAVYPRDAGHDFPPDVREQAYRFLDRWLR